MKQKLKDPAMFHPLELSALVMAIVAFGAGALAQDGLGQPPENAQKRNFGSGWNCNIGYRVDEGRCVKLDIPENAYATGRSYGIGWACRRGFNEVNRESCEAIFVPENAFLRSSGYDWQCERGFRQDREACVG